MEEQHTTTERTVTGQHSIGLTARIERYLSLSALTIGLWAAVLVATTLDVLTTLIGLGVGLSEGNVLARGLLETLGPPGLIGLKLAALAILAVTWYCVDQRQGHAALAGFGGVTIVVVGVNLVTIVTA